MSRRNFILLIIVLGILLIIFGLISLSNRNSAQPGEDGGFFSNLNPFGNSGTGPGYTTPAYNTPTDEEVVPPIIEEARLTKVSSLPVAGYGIFQKERTEKEFVPAVRYVSKETGNLYQTFADEIKERKYSNTAIPKIHEAFVTNNGDTVLMRYLGGDDTTIRTFIGTIPKENLGSDTTDAYEIKGIFLPDNVSDISLSRDGSKLFYLVPSGEGVNGLTHNLKDGKKTQIFESLFTEWTPYWATSNIVTLTTKPTTSLPGYMYSLDVNKKFTKTLGEINGLSTLMSPNGGVVLYNDNTLALSIYDSRTRESRTAGLRTHIDKCVWAKDGTTIYCAAPRFIAENYYPDAWYQGEISFSDQIWKIDIKTGITTLLLDPITVTTGEDIDAVKLELDAGENYLFFINQKDSFLWKFDLK